MRKALLFLLTPLLFSACNSSKEADAQSAKEKGYIVATYHRSIEFGDMGAAIYSIQSLLSRDTANYSYYDSLAILYYNSRNYPQALKAADRAIMKYPNEEKLLRLMADAAKKMDRDDLALPYFLKLIEITKDPKIQYEAAVSEFYSKHYDDAEKAVNTTLQTPGTEKVYVKIIADGGKQQDVPLHAALYNLLGFVREKQGKKPEAADCYRKALEIFPDFILAKNNLEATNKK